jgi:tight adherence protein B
VTFRDVAPMTELMKWGSLAVVGLGLFIATFTAARDPTSFGYRYWNRYTSSMERKLRPMFIFVPGRRIALGQCIVLFLFLTAHILIDIPYWYLGVVLIAAVPGVYIEQLRKQRVEMIESQLDGFLLALANALKTTPSIGAALASVATVIQVPMRQEVDLALKEMKVGSSLDQALLHMASRVGSRQLDSALSSILIGRQVGGNLPKVLETTSSTMREMQRLEGVVRTKTAEARFQLWAIGLLPFVLVVLLNALWPGYFKPLEGNMIGYILIGVASTFWVSAIVLARKVLSVDL